MGTIEADISEEDTGDLLIDKAASLGFALVRGVSHTGQIVREWQRGDEPRPQFASERVARHWMSEWLERFGEASRGEAC
jgi:hypothetical protein